MVEKDGCFVVKDNSGQAFGFYFFRLDPALSPQAGALVKNEARRMAENFTRLPDRD